jgi:alkylation response protein AidB-like acyl-CoA dehydrogenase
MSQILVPADTPGLRIEPVSVSGHRGRGWSTHCEVWYSGVRVPASNVLGGRGDGFRIAQKRLGPGRIHHVMRWLGQMQRAFELMCSYALEREAFGGRLADKQTVQNWIAIHRQIQACGWRPRRRAGRRAGEGANGSRIKFYAARMFERVIDRAVQVPGALGLTDRTPLATC